MRLDKYLAETAQCTRSEAKAMLSKGRVQVNGAVCKKGDTQLKESDTVAVDGKVLCYQQFVYLMLNKPEGVVSASTDKRDTTVVDLVGDAYPRRELFPAGRLDKTSTGFVLLTDDGTFAHGPFARRGDGADRRRPHRAGGAQARRLSPDQTDVRRVRRGGERAAPGRHRRPCTGRRAGPGAVAGAFCRRSVKNYQLKGRPFHPFFKKATHFAGRIDNENHAKRHFFGLKVPRKIIFTRKNYLFC